MFTERDGLDLREEPSEALDRLAKEVIGAALEVHRWLGPGQLESAYEEAMCVELTLRNIPWRRQVKVWLDYKGHRVGEGVLDLLVGDALIVELKACDTILPVHRAQAISYLRITGHRLALLINFNVPLLKDGVKRIIQSA